MTLEQVFPLVLESFDLDAYHRLLKLVPEYNRPDACNRIVQYCFEHGRLMDESLRLLEEVKENQFGHKSILEDEIPNIILARECSKIGADGSVSQTAQRSVFRKFHHYNGRRERFLVAKWLWVSSSQREKLLEAIKSTKAGEDEKARILFDEVFHAIPNRGVPDTWGAYNPSDALCAIALIQIELGKPDWARELIPKIVIPERDDSMQQYALSFRMKIADLQFMLGETAAARKTIEDLGNPVVPRVWGDLAVALFERDDADGAREVLEAVLNHLEKGEYAREQDIDALLEACIDIDDKEMIDNTIERVLKVAEPETNHYRNEFKKSILNALIRLHRFDEAKELSKDKWMSGAAKDIAGTLLEAKRYGEAEEYITTLRWGELQVDTMRAIAKARFDADDKDGACETINKALDFAYVDYGRSYKPMFDIA